MPLIRPILNLPNTTFDANSNIQISFISNGGDQIVANNIEVYLNSNNTLIYSNKTVVPTFSLSQTIPSGKLSNGNVYKIHVQTFNSNGNASLWSDYVLIYTYSLPIIDISNVSNGGTVNNQTFTFTGTYNQAQNDPLQSYTYTLYDSNMVQLATSPLLYDGLLQYQFTGFNNDTNYSITLEVNSQHGTSNSIIKSFQANYVQPIFSNLITLINNQSQASVDVTVEAIRILGRTTGTVSIENGDWLNALNGICYFDNNNGFEIPSGDWSLQLWVSNLVDNKTVVNGTYNTYYEGTLITKFYVQNNVTFKIEYYDGCFHLYKFIGSNLFGHYMSNSIYASSSNTVYLFVQYINGRFNLQAQIYGSSGYGVAGYGAYGYGM